MKNNYFAIFAAPLIIALPLYSGSANDFIGSVWATGANYCPDNNSLLADGRLLKIQDYNALFAVFGTTYGGDGVNTFALPNLQGQTPIGVGQGKDNGGANTLQPVSLGEARGKSQITLSASNLPPHTHSTIFTPVGKASPVNVGIQISSNTTGNTNQPSTTNNYLSASSGGSAGANMWSSSQGSAPVSINGVKASIASNANAGTVTLNPIGDNKPINTIAPAFGVTYCVTTIGIYPVKP